MDTARVMGALRLLGAPAAWLAALASIAGAFALPAAAADNAAVAAIAQYEGHVKQSR